jgi:hypothetical protein
LLQLNQPLLPSKGAKGAAAAGTAAAAAGSSGGKPAAGAVVTAVVVAVHELELEMAVGKVGFRSLVCSGFSLQLALVLGSSLIPSLLRWCSGGSTSTGI